MIALIDDLDKKKVNNKLKKQKNALGWLRQTLAELWAGYQKRKIDRIALYQLMQLDDALLQDIGLTRHEIMSVTDDASTFDALVKKDILSNRDNACSTILVRK